MGGSCLLHAVKSKVDKRIPINNDGIFMMTGLQFHAKIIKTSPVDWGSGLKCN
jgi:hypothetical protein